MHLTQKIRTFALILGLVIFKALEASAGMSAEEVKAFDNHKEMTAKGDIASEYQLGRCYVNGDGVLRDEEKGFNYIKSAAEKGLSEAQFYVGCIYLGEGKNQNYQKSIDWLTKSAKQGNPDAQYMLGYVYKFGLGTDPNNVLAAQWYRKSAEQNNPDAAYSLGLAYLRGSGVSASNREAAFWLKISADNGKEQAQFELAQLYVSGDGIPKDEIEAYVYFNLASGIPNARHALKLLEQRMPAEARLIAQQRTKQLQKQIEGRVDNLDDLRKAIQKEQLKKGA